ncbi:SGNH/GDSL hydrolase family protein [Allostreptomyces psammosilenae]|uniref:Lysophospholipase L1-like esterase n=1 Tax=Allostreptomyces psammosilenae TaxID=1892865 RepID=A0A853A125_9ACTN|nr:SGNH/GDSL hydrolase family protein [Allostreptomyces psammosilenae]NYI08323.1 lysophospholipase L1-like esterase [Allostreptomyces psammosilenae]
MALGDSFTEGLNDPGPAGGWYGWADRLAGMIASAHPELRYANLAVRGRLLDRIVSEQVPQALAFAPDLVSFSAGGNDIIRPGSDPDEVAARYADAVRRMTEAGSTVLVFTGFDTRETPVLRRLRGKVATYNGHVRAIADRYDCPVVDLWALRTLSDRRAWSADRLHLSSEGHRRVALLAAQAIGIPVDGDPREPWPLLPPVPRVAALRENVHWTREHLLPWVGRRLRGVSSGDLVRPKQPELAPYQDARTGRTTRLGGGGCATQSPVRASHASAEQRTSGA